MKYDTFRALKIVKLASDYIWRRATATRVNRVVAFLYAVTRQYDSTKNDNAQAISLDASNIVYGAWVTLHALSVKLDCNEGAYDKTAI